MRFKSALAALSVGMGVSMISVSPSSRPAAMGISGTARGGDGIPQVFRITPTQSRHSTLAGVVYSPKLRFYVVFYVDHGAADLVFSRLYNANGQPMSGPQKILEMKLFSISGITVAYNARDDCFLLVGGDEHYDALNGVRLDGRGRLPGGPLTVIPVKPSTGDLSAFYPMAQWIAAASQYAVTWTYWDRNSPNHPRNGAYLTVLNRDFSVDLEPKLVRAQRMKDYPQVARLGVLADKLIWGGSEQASGSTRRPLAWFTDLEGKVLSSLGAAGRIVPEGGGPGWMSILPVVDPDHERILLGWSYSDEYQSGDAGYFENHFRLIDGRGRFTTGLRIVPKRQPFQFPGGACYSPAEKRFFWVCDEYKIVHQDKPERSFFGGALWGFYLDSDGNFEDKKGNDALSPVPLTYTNLDPTMSTSFRGLAANADQKSYLVVYTLERRNSGSNELWGLIYK